MRYVLKVVHIFGTSYSIQLHIREKIAYSIKSFEPHLAMTIEQLLIESSYLTKIPGEQ